MHTTEEIKKKCDAIVAYLNYNKGRVITDIQVDQIKALTSELKAEIETIKK